MHSIVRTGLGLLAIVITFISCSEDQDITRPNILFCISDDQSYPHASAYGCSFVSTPAFDEIADQGILFTNCFVAAPSCGPSRASILTGKPFYQLQEASMNHLHWPEGLGAFTDLLAENGYHVGYTGKGWGPGVLVDRVINPAGKPYKEIKNEVPGKFINNEDYAANFEMFLQDRKNRPFCFWFGAKEPHRPLDWQLGAKSGKEISEIIDFPEFMPDADTVRYDLLDYANEIEWFDQHLMRMIAKLKELSELKNTLIVVTSDNGMAFPGAKPNLYDAGARVPLAVSWGDKLMQEQKSDQLVSLMDWAPTFLELAAIKAPSQMTGKSMLPYLTGTAKSHRDYVVYGLERHGGAKRPGSTDFPSRAIRTSQYLYIKNFHPDHPPLGELSGPVWPSDDPTGGSGWSDGGPTKTFFFNHKAEYPELFQKTFVSRPGEELYDISTDPGQLHNLADNTEMSTIKHELAKKLMEELERTDDPRIMGGNQYFEDLVNGYGSH
jgi:N-sulfoglucosamine sulfohydrolase